FLSKPIRVHLKYEIFIPHQLPFTRCSFTIISFNITDLDPRSPILFSLIL
ncbi:hypothetical protein HOY80DRAFT_897743, partial [Tuber brumale]